MAGIKAASDLTAGGRIPSGKINSSLAELYYLSLVEAPMRLLVLTNPEFHKIFLKKTSGAITDGITVVCMLLPEAMQAEVGAVVRRASDEVSPAVAEKKSPSLGVTAALARALGTKPYLLIQAAERRLDA